MWDEMEQAYISVPLICLFLFHFFLILQVWNRPTHNIHAFHTACVANKETLLLTQNKLISRVSNLFPCQVKYGNRAMSWGGGKVAGSHFIDRCIIPFDEIN